MRFVSVVVLMILSVAAVNAGTVVTLPDSYSFDPTQTNFNTTINVAQYNPLDYLGMALSSVHIYLAGTATSGGGESALTCVAGGAGGVCEGTEQSTVTLMLTALSGTVQLAEVIPFTTYSYTLSQGGYQPIGVQTNTKTDGWNVFTTTAILNAFTGTGNIALNVAGAGTTNLGSTNGFVLGGVQTFGSGTVQVAYDYDTGTPEPVTLAMIGGGLLGIGIWGRKRSA